MGRRKSDHPREGFYKTRLAPTPSGYLHLGNAFAFALTASLALRSNAKLLLRIDDLDTIRAKPEYVKDIFHTLDFLGIDWQEGPEDPAELDLLFSQTLRMPLYIRALEKLRTGGHLFACTCNRSELESGKGYPGTCRDRKIPLDTPGASWRLKTEGTGPVSFNDYSAGIITGTLPVSMTDFVVRKKDGLPAYQLTSVVDDEFFRIDFIVRGEDLIPSSMAQLILARLLGYERFCGAEFFFHALFKDNDGRKLSKSNKDLSIASLIKKKMSPENVYYLIGRTIDAGEEVSSWHLLAQHVLGQLP